MKNLIFESKCLRCNSINKIDFTKRFGDVNELSIADLLIMKFRDGFVTPCPVCGIATMHIPVTLIL